MRRNWVSLSLCIIFSLFLMYIIFMPRQSNQYVNVYNWYGMMDPKVIQQFEKETGIKVRYDLFDSNDVLEAKLLAGHSGYDIVFPSAAPYMKGQIIAKVYQPLDRSQIPNWENIDPDLLKTMQETDPENRMSIPFYWGTLGFAYNEAEILKRFPGAPVRSYRMLFDPTIVSRFRDRGVTLLEEAVDVYPQVLLFLGRDPHSDNLNDLDETQKQLLHIRPFIIRFSSSRFVEELVSGQTCLAQVWSGEAQIAIARGKETGKKIIYVIPEEGSSLWIDAIGIPRDAPHPQNAHKFINFLLRPEISAQISAAARLAIANRHVKDHLDDTIKQDPTIYPPSEIVRKLSLDRSHSQDYERIRTRLWAEVRFATQIEKVS